eukprot:4653081-Pyramimonas_sp.AAC.1
MTVHVSQTGGLGEGLCCTELEDPFHTTKIPPDKHGNDDDSFPHKVAHVPQLYGALPMTFRKA